MYNNTYEVSLNGCRAHKLRISAGRLSGTGEGEGPYLICEFSFQEGGGEGRFLFLSGLLRMGGSRRCLFVQTLAKRAQLAEFR